jgi:anti-anti-sigma factor
VSRTLIHPDRTVAAPPDFRCTLRDGGLDVVSVWVAGELDIASASKLKQTLRHAEERARRVVLDLRELTFMDSSGVHAIVDANVRAAVAGRRLVVVRGRSRVDRVLTLTGACDRLDIVDLAPTDPPVQALVQLAQRERTASCAASAV